MTHAHDNLTARERSIYRRTRTRATFTLAHLVLASLAVLFVAAFIADNVLHLTTAPVAHAATTTPIHDNAYYCAQLVINHERVHGATPKQVATLCSREIATALAKPV